MPTFGDLPPELQRMLRPFAPVDAGGPGTAGDGGTHQAVGHSGDMGGNSVSLGLPWPPSVNNIWRRVVINGQPRTLVSREGREYREKVRAIAYGCKPLVGLLAIDIEACPPDFRRRDLDNILKATLDALTYAGIWRDDNQVCEIHVRRMRPVQDGWLSVKVQRPRLEQGELLP